MSDNYQTSYHPDDRLAEAIEALRELDEGTREKVPWEHGETVYLYCRKAGKHVAHTVMRYGDRRPFALCGRGGCTDTTNSLPDRRRIAEGEFAVAAVKAVRAALSGGDAT